MKLLYQEELVEHYIEYQGEIIRNHTKIGYLAQELTQNQNGYFAIYNSTTEINLLRRFLYIFCPIRIIN